MWLKLMCVAAVCSSTACWSATETTLIAPMLEGNGLCAAAFDHDPDMTLTQAGAYCYEHNQSSAELLERKLTDIGPKLSSDGQFELGYMLGLSLLSYIEFDGEEVVVNRKRVKDSLKLLRDSDRSAVLYFFANHFVGGDIIEQAKIIAASGDELMLLNNGESPMDGYFSSAVYPWRVGDRSTLYYDARMKAFDAVLEELCGLPAADLAKVRAVTTLGEVHHQFPNFKQGMGYGAKDYQITDYSAPTVAAFRRWLADKFDSIEQFNDELEANYQSFDQVNPPSKDIRKESLATFFDHLDPYAHGVLPFFGWAYAPNGKPFSINVYLDGRYIGKAQTGLTRVDVAQAIDGLDDSNVGYRYDLDFSKLDSGRHKVELRFMQFAKETLLQEYEVAVVDRKQSTPELVKGQYRPPVKPQETDNIRFWADHPAGTVGVFYNPLAKLWLNFREQSVTQEIEGFADRLNQSCIGPERVFSHQIAPDFNPTWDPTLFAVSDSLQQNEHYNLGINLYGGIISSDILFDWLAEQRHDRYGLPEMHPMLAQDPEQFADNLRRHHEHGAVFLSPYFISLVPPQEIVDEEHDKFKLSPKNPSYGSDTFYRALQQVMK